MFIEPFPGLPQAEIDRIAGLADARLRAAVTDVRVPLIVQGSVVENTGDGRYLVEAWWPASQWSAASPTYTLDVYTDRAVLLYEI